MECEELDNACTLSWNGETGNPRKEAAMKNKEQFGCDDIISLFGKVFLSKVEHSFNFLMTNKLKITITIEKAE